MYVRAHTGSIPYIVAVTLLPLAEHVKYGQGCTVSLPGTNSWFELKMYKLHHHGALAYSTFYQLSSWVFVRDVRCPSVE